LKFENTTPVQTRKAIYASKIKQYFHCRNDMYSMKTTQTLATAENKKWPRIRFFSKNFGSRYDKKRRILPELTPAFRILGQWSPLLHKLKHLKPQNRSS